MRKSFVALLLLFLSFTALASESTEPWVEVQSPHFRVVTDSNERDGRRIASQFERMRAVFHTLFPTMTADSGAPITVLAFRDKKGFRGIEPAGYLARGKLDLAGMFLRSPNQNYVVLRLDTDGMHPYETVYHEYTHFMLSGAQAWLPLWLNEGLAEFYQNTDIQDKVVLLGEPNVNDILYLRQNRLLPLATLLAVDHLSPYYHDEQKGSVFYAESWALTHYLMMADHEKNTHRLQDYALYVSQNEGPVAAALHAFGDLNLLEKALDAYVGQLNFKLFRMNGTVGFDESSLQVRAIPASEADVVRAEVMVGTERQAEAEALLGKVLQDDPKSADAHEAMGFLKYRAGDIAGARKWYGEAVQLDSHSFLAQYYFALLSLRMGTTDSDAAIESSLRAANTLNPAFAPAYDTLSMFYLARHEKLDEAHLLTVKAVHLEPSVLQYRVDGAEVLAGQKDFESAVNVLNAAMRVAKTPADVALVQSRIDQVGQLQASVKGEHKGESVEATNSVVRMNGKAVAGTELAELNGLHYTSEKATGPHHVVGGVLRHVKCSYPAVITLSVEEAGKSVSLYGNNYYKIVFTTLNYTPTEDILPCTGIEGMKARVNYAEIADKTIGGQIMSIELSK